MILASAGFGVMQVPVHQEVGVIAMRDGFVAATRTVLMRAVVTATVMAGSGGTGISGVDGDNMFVYVSLVQMMHVSIVEIIRVALVLNGGMAASRAVLMGMCCVRVTFLLCHE
jgi:hypothetical protein